jgi:GT2 family glycosyltransferase/glycosyltransferase involved in cell wall biosynthesis
MIKSKNSSDSIHIAKIFLNSTTFLVWQKYCIQRSLVATKLGYEARYEVSVPTEKDIKKYILPAKTFKLWLKTYYTRIALHKYFIEVPYNYLKANTPQPVKIFLKKNFNFLVGLTGGHLNSYIKADWSRWSRTRSDSSLDIIIFGITSYDYRFQRPQQLAQALAGLGHRVFYIDSEFNYALTAAQSWIQVKKKAKNVFVVKLSAPHNYFIYKDQPTKRGQQIMFSAIKKLLFEAKIINPVAKIDHPFWGSIADKLKMPIVYDAMDLHSGFTESSKVIAEREASITSGANLILTSSTYLEKTFKKYHNKSIMVRNAGDYEHFSKTKSRLAKPIDLRMLPGKVLGYYGAIADWMDEKIIRKVAEDYPNDSLVLIGRIQNRKIEKLAKEYSNIYLLGEKNYVDLPKYLSFFDVALIPFKITNLIKATNPVKIYEYFASGKPVITTKIPELEVFSKYLYIGLSPADFSAKIGKALVEKSAKLGEGRRRIAKENTWEMRAKVLNNEVQKFYPKVSVVILVYNHVDLSKISIDSVLERSKYPNLELILVDNNSDAETVKMLKTYVGRDKVKVILNKVNHGFAKGNNIGMKAATGEYIILLNNDVRVTPGWIERLMYHAKPDSVGLVGPVTNSIGNESKINIDYNWNNAKQIEDKSAVYTYAHWGETLKLRNVAAFAWIMSRKVYKKIGDLDERFGRGLFEDDDYCVRVGNAKLDIYCADDAFVHHYGGASTNWGSPEFQLLFNTNKEKFEKKWKTKWIPHQYRKR